MPAAQQDDLAVQERPEWFQRWLTEWEKKLRHVEHPAEDAEEQPPQPVKRRDAA